MEQSSGVLNYIKFCTAMQAIWFILSLQVFIFYLIGDDSDATFFYMESGIVHALIFDVESVCNTKVLLGVYFNIEKAAN